MKQKKNTIILSVTVVLLAIAAIVFQMLFLKKEGAYALVQVQHEQLYRLDLQKETELTVESGNGFNKIEVKDGAVIVTEADCPDKICVRTGYIRKTGEVIACLPHELTVTIAGAEAQEDAMVH